MASSKNGTLYAGVTSNLVRRVWEHKENVVEGFTKMYGVHMLVYYEMYDTFEEAGKREKQLKWWKRDWKLKLIESMNSNWDDLYKEII